MTDIDLYWAGAERRLLGKVREGELSPLMRLREAFRLGFETGEAAGKASARSDIYRELEQFVSAVGMGTLTDN